MSTRKLSNWLDTWMKYTENTEPPELYRLWCGISTIAAVLQRKCFLSWGLDTYYYPNMFIVLVGPSGARKGTAMAPAKHMLRKMGIRLSTDATSPSKLVNFIMRSSTGEPVATGNKIKSYLTHCSVTIFSEELSVFLGYGNQELIGYLCDWFDCKEDWVYDTRQHGEEIIQNMWVNLIGATTPETLRTSLPRDMIGMGLASRIIFVYEEKKGKHVSFPFMTAEQEKMKADLLHDLTEIHQLRGPFLPSEDFFLRYDECYRSMEKHPPIIDPRFAGYVSRRMVHLLKLTMIVAVSEGTMNIETSHLEKAIRILEKTEVKMPRTLMGIGANPFASIQSEMLKTIAGYGAIQGQELAKMFMDEASYDDLCKILVSLQRAGLIEWETRTGMIKYVKGKKEM